MSPSTETDLFEKFEVHPERGFLPMPDPLAQLPGEFDAWEEMAADLPKRLVSGRVRAFIDHLPPFPTHRLANEREYRRAMGILSYLGHAYVWGERAPTDRLPSVLARPWYRVAHRLGRPPVLSYASYALDNWRRLDPEQEIALGNIALLQNFLGGIDEEWFILVHVDIEAKAAPALAALPAAQRAVRKQDWPALEDCLAAIEGALGRMVATLERMPEHCDPYIYYHRVRPYIHGWKNNPAVPKGVVYEGVKPYGGMPQCFRGETGAQSAIIPSLDALLGVTHKDDPLKTYLMEMRDYMPARHQAFIAAIEQGPSVRAALLSGAPHSACLDRYRECIRGVERFRSLHLEYAARYIYKQDRTSRANPTRVGTGGTPFMRYLKKHRDETSRHIPGDPPPAGRRGPRSEKKRAT